MTWTVLFHDEFEAEFHAFASDVQDELLAHAEVLAQFGPSLGRPHVDTLAGSHHTNMKELRFRADNGVWRIAFAFDPERRAILLVGGDKSGVSQARFYKKLIHTADARFAGWLSQLDNSTKENEDAP
jgi:hypothetical protein